MKKISEYCSKSLEKMPVSDHCPLIKNTDWKCRGLDKGNEPQCKSVSGYMNCPSFQKWFWWNVRRMAAKEIVSSKRKRSKKKK